jgi:hypothetical protein
MADKPNSAAAEALLHAVREGEFNPDAQLKIRSWEHAQTRLTPEVELAIIEAARAGHFRADQAIAGGVDPKTLRLWVRKGKEGDPVYAEFARRVAAAEFEAKDRLIVKVKAGALTDVRAAQWLLERRWKAQFAARVKVIHSVIMTERRLIIDVVSELLDDFERAVLSGETPPENLFDAFATRFDARLSQAQEATEEAIEAEFADDG